MFTVEERDRIREHVVGLARSDPRVTAGALTGSSAVGAEDERSDIDVAFGIADDVSLEVVLHDWTEELGRAFGVIHHWDVRSGPSIYRVFLLPNGLEIDIGVSPRKEFGARGLRFRPLFGEPSQVVPLPPPDSRYLIGLGWHYVFHARSSIERGKSWLAEYWISAIRDETLTLACLRLGEETSYGRGYDRLPTTITEPLEGSLVNSLDVAELRRALAVGTQCFINEVERWDPALCARLKPLLQECGVSQT